MVTQSICLLKGIPTTYNCLYNSTGGYQERTAVHLVQGTNLQPFQHKNLPRFIQTRLFPPPRRRAPLHAKPHRRRWDGVWGVCFCGVFVCRVRLMEASQRSSRKTPVSNRSFAILLTTPHPRDERRAELLSKSADSDPAANRTGALPPRNRLGSRSSIPLTGISPTVSSLFPALT